jgi:hypothetical protein
MAPIRQFCRMAVPGRAQTLMLAVVFLAALPPNRLAAQAIAVVATPAFRPTAVLQPHLRYVVATDSADGTAIVRDLGVPPVTFTGTIRIEGVQPGARAPEATPFADTVRFEPDGRVVMLLADAAGRPPMSVEVIGARGAAAGRLVITAPRFPLGRALLVTIAPADLYDMTGRRLGFGVRDRLRVDDRNGMAYLADSSAGPTTVAIGFGRGAHGRIQPDIATIVRARDFGGAEGRERRQLGALIFAIDPARDEAGTARAEIIFGVGNSEAEANQAARGASTEPPGAPAAALLRLRTPAGEVDLLARHLLAAAGWMLDWDVVGSERAVPASASRPAVRAVDAWQGASLALQRGDTAAVCGAYRLVTRATGAAPATRVEVGPRLAATGRILAASDSSDAASDAALVLLAYTCYATGHDASLLRQAWPALRAAAARAARDGPAELAAESVDRLGELDDELARLAGGGWESSGDSLRAEALRLAPATASVPAALWRTAVTEAQRGISRDYGRLSSGGAEGGVSFGSAGAWLDLVAGEVFGVAEFLDHLEIGPQIAGVADESTWQLEGWRLASGDTLSIAYRPADRRATVLITAPQRRRLALRFPWLTARSCVTARRGPDRAERLALIQQADGSFYVDVRGAYEAADIRIAAGACEN